MNFSLYDQLCEAQRAIDGRLSPVQKLPTVGLVLGSGLGAYADTFADAQAIAYADIPHFPRPRVEGHAGQLVVGRKSNVVVATLQGRVHFYEGYSTLEVTFPIRTLITLGCQTIIITNAAGGIHPEFAPGDLVLIRDHINLFLESPLRGTNDVRLGPRFPDMTQAYAPELRLLALRAATRLGITLHEGIYAGLPGPSYETPAEIRMFKMFGADLCGMSTVPEVIAAHHQGARVLGISLVSNRAAGLSETPLSHDEVVEAGRLAQPKFQVLLDAILREME